MVVGQLCLLDWECSFSEENTLEGAGLLLYYLHRCLMKVVSGVPQVTLEERNRAEDRDVYKETSFKETICSDGQSTI